MQEALARAWERSERGEAIRSLEAWVTTVATNLARSGLRRLLAERRARSRLQAAAPRGPSAERTDVRQALAALPRRQREVTVLRYYLDLGVAEIAEVLRVSEGTVKTSLYRAREALARSLGDAAEEADDVGRS